MIDALLGATGLGNIGQRFPDTDSRYKNADSRELLGEVARQVRDMGFGIANIDSNILAEQPRLLPWLAAMASNAASAAGVSSEQITVKAKTMEGLGPIGKGEAIAAEAVVLVYAP
jgi:2-C-methyl-D-erythritol 2,4-cyclodiphosphate synthase